VSVYVDQPRYPLGRMIMCHMLADSLEELHAMAGRIGVQRRHFQHDGRWPHYDICKAKRELAIRHGAIETSTKDILRRMKGLR
jgi:hypothetical protein